MIVIDRTPTFLGQCKIHGKHRCRFRTRMVEDQTISLSSPPTSIADAGNQEDAFNYTFEVKDLRYREEGRGAYTKYTPRDVPVSSTTYIRTQESQPAAPGLGRWLAAASPGKCVGSEEGWARSGREQGAVTQHGRFLIFFSIERKCDKLDANRSRRWIQSQQRDLYTISMLI